MNGQGVAKRMLSVASLATCLWTRDSGCAYDFYLPLKYRLFALSFEDQVIVASEHSGHPGPSTFYSRLQLILNLARYACHWNPSHAPLLQAVLSFVDKNDGSVSPLFGFVATIYTCRIGAYA